MEPKISTVEPMTRDEFRKIFDEDKKKKSPVSPVDYTAIEAGPNIQSADSINPPQNPISESSEENEGAMYRVQLEKINDFVQYILPVISSQSDAPSWIQDKITLSKHNLEAIYDFYKGIELPKGTDTVEG